MSNPNLSLQERERLAYIEGRIEEAKLLAELDDTKQRAFSVGFDEGYELARRVASGQRAH